RRAGPRGAGEGRPPPAPPPAAGGARLARGGRRGRGRARRAPRRRGPRATGRERAPALGGDPRPSPRRDGPARGAPQRGRARVAGDPLVRAERLEPATLVFHREPTGWLLLAHAAIIAGNVLLVV